MSLSLATFLPFRVIKKRVYIFINQYYGLFIVDIQQYPSFFKTCLKQTIISIQETSWASYFLSIIVQQSPMIAISVMINRLMKRGKTSKCCILAFDPAKNAIPRWCTGRKWHILMAVMRGNRVGGNWLMKWDELKNSHGTLIDWCTGREWPVNCMTVISAWWRSNMRFQRSSGRSSGRWTII